MRRFRWWLVWPVLLWLPVVAVYGILVAMPVVAWRAGDEAINASLLTIGIVIAAVALLARPLTTARARAAAARATPEELSHWPDDLHPAVVGLLVRGRGRGERSMVAATVLELAHREQLAIDGLDAVNFTVTVPPAARGHVPFEFYVIQNLRFGAGPDETVTLQGPPLWGEGQWNSPSMSSFRRDVLQLAKNLKLQAGGAAGGVALLAIVAMGFVGLRTDPVRWMAMVVLFGGWVVTGIAGFVIAEGLSPAGERARAKWLAYARWLRSNAELDDVDVPGFLVWGRHLVYGTILGCCPRVAAALSPRFASDEAPRRFRR
jgi:hypothetical protein